MAIQKRQSRTIFVVIKVYKNGKGAEHRNMKSICLYYGALHLMGALIHILSTNINGITHLKK